MGKESPYERITRALLTRNPTQRGNDFICPAHADDKPSLGVTEREGKVLIKCMAGCSTSTVLRKLGMKMADLSTKERKPTEVAQPLPSEAAIRRWADALASDRYWTKKRGVSREVLEDYEVGWDEKAKSPDGRVGAYTIPYRDEAGRLLNVKRRWNSDDSRGKTFQLYKGHATGFLWPEDQLDERWVVLVEGEPDVLRAVSLGIPAATWVTGAGGASKAARTFAPKLEGLHVVLVPDADEAGRKAVQQLASIIAPYAETVRIFDPFPDRSDGSDLSDWLDHVDDDVDRFHDELRKLLVIAPTDFDMPGHDYLFPSDKFNPPRLGMAAEDAGKLRIGPGRSLWRYEDGVYHLDGEEWLAWYVRTVLREDFRKNRLSEVREWCFANGDRIPTQPQTDYINVRNGLLYWQEDPPRLEAHSPDVPSIIQVNAAWDPKASCPEIRSFLGTVLPDDCMDFMFEWVGHLLIPDSRRFQRALMLWGPRDTGKSTLLIAIQALLGDAAVSHHTLQSICDDRFTAADLYGRLANIYADLDSRNVQSSGKFKAIVGGDAINAERKFGHTFSFKPFARLIFSANEPPGTNDQSDAYYKRWLIMPMHHQFADVDQDPGLERRLTSPEELSGFLREAIDGLKRLDARGRFVVPKSMKEAAARYRANTDTIVAWGDEQLVWDRKKRVRVKDAYEDYARWCDDNNRKPLGRQRFQEHVAETFPRLRSATRDGYQVLVGAGLFEAERLKVGG